MPEYRDTVTGAGPIGAIDPGHSETSDIDFVGDRDVWQTHLVAGLTYFIEQRGDTSSSGTLHDPYMRLYLPSDPNIAYLEDDDSGDDVPGHGGYRDSLITYTASSTGSLFIQAGAYSDADYGSYTVLVSEGAGSAFADAITGSAYNDGINGMEGNDTVSGANGNDTLRGYTGQDQLLGGNGNDLLTGGEDSDTLRGQGGNDKLLGGNKADLLVGGAGNDVFDFDSADQSSPAQRDTIGAGDGATAFQGAGNANGDRIDLADIYGPSLTFGGTGRGHVWVTTSGTDTIVHANIDNDAVSEFELRIADAGVGANQYNAHDFIL